MKFTLSWLKEHLDTDAEINAISDALTRIGLEVEGIENPADKLNGFKVAKILTAAPHPQADKLQVLTVDAGEGPVQVVCGAPNARSGLYGVFGVEGATVPANGMVLRKAAIRGVESNGMMCSTRELELGEDHDGIIELPEGVPVGMAFADYAKLNDPVIDVSITPNRQDCMGVRGIARDLAAAGFGALKPLVVPQITPSFPCPVEIRTDDQTGCPAFFGRVIKGVNNGVSPEWMQRRLQAVGQRPISALVDITNYVMLDHGRPSHAYDLATLSGPVVARKAKMGETVTALNGKEYTLDETMTVIADANGAHDIAGIMGGEHSGCAETTTDVLLEVAYFDPDHIARTGQKLALASDARSRFERGVDPAFLDDAMELLTELILSICGGEASEIVRAGQPPELGRTIQYDPQLSQRLGGVDVPDTQQRQILAGLGFKVDAGWTVLVPSWRRDVDGATDLVEEVIRVIGLDNVPSTPLPRDEGVARPTATPLQMVERKARRAAAARGLQEAITWSFLPEAQAAAFGGGTWSLANPISEDLKVMRPSLLPGLLAAAQRNADRGADSIRLFEIGRRYLAEGERLTLGVVLAGERSPRNWQSGKSQGFDAFDAKAEALALLAAAGAPIDNLQVMGEAGDHFHPGQSATLRLGPKNVVASFGALHPVTAKTFDLDGPVVAIEIYLDALPTKKGKDGFVRPAYTPPALQAVRRDFAFLMAADEPVDGLIRAVRGADKVNITGVRLFDLFTGQGVPDGQKSVAIEVTLQPVDKSYDEAELKAISDKVVAAAAKTGALLRG